MRKTQAVRGVLLFACVAWLGAPSALHAGANDTVEALQAAARRGVEDVGDLQAVLDDAQGLISGLDTDAAFQSAVFEAINNNDQTALSSTLRQKVTRSTFSFKSLDTSRSFLFDVQLRKGGKTAHVCLSSTRKCGPNFDRFANIRFE